MQNKFAIIIITDNHSYLASVLPMLCNLVSLNAIIAAGQEEQLHYIV